MVRHIAVHMRRKAFPFFVIENEREHENSYSSKV